MLSHIAKSLILPALLAICWLPHASLAAELTAIHNAKLIDAPSNDGDSFFVAVNGDRLHLRLYYVDCAETQSGSAADVERIRDQMRYFGLSDPAAVVDFGKKAKQFAEDVLSKPFVIYTGYAKAPGRSAGGRIYGFVKTRDGRYLSDMLVEKGLARVHGTSRTNPDGITSKMVSRKLRDLETAAILRRAGMWKESDPDRIIKSRALQRQQKQELDAFREKIAKTRAPGDKRLNPNTATSEQLQSIKGIGPVLADKIISGRPYNSVDDLLKVHGIGPKTLKKIAPYLTTNQ